MKTLVVILAAVSVAVNLLLVGVLFMGRSAASRETEAPAAASVSPVAKTPQEAESDSGIWSELQTDDRIGLIQRLRDAGFPPEAVRAILAAQLREAYAERLKALNPSAGSSAFWKGTNLDPKVQREQRRLYREMEKELRALLGPDAESSQSTLTAVFQRRRFDSVPPEKLADVRQLVEAYEEARQDIFSVGASTITPAVRNRVAELEKEHQAALASVLTPQELAEYNLRNSDTARQLRNTLMAFDPTEQEFRTLYQMQAEFDHRYGSMFSLGTNSEERQRRMEAQRELNAQIQAVLGPVRGEEYERTTDGNYRQTSQLVARLQLPPETTTQVWQVKKDIETRANAIRTDRTLSVEDRRTQFTALAEEATARISPLLGGERGMEVYKQYGGAWMRSLTPPAPRQVTPPPR